MSNKLNGYLVILGHGEVGRNARLMVCKTFIQRFKSARRLQLNQGVSQKRLTPFALHVTSRGTFFYVTIEGVVFTFQ